MPEQPDERMLERFWAKVDRDGETGCWLWVANKTHDGYGRFSVGSKYVYAHRFAWTLENGQVQEGLQLDHLCRVRECVNPAHMEPVDCRTNVLRGVSPSAMRAAQIECIHGHKFDDTNTYWRPDGGRECRTCHRQREREYRAKETAGRPKVILVGGVPDA